MVLFRGMRPDPGDGLPVVGTTATSLGVRLDCTAPGTRADIDVVDGRVHPHTGGMSVVADDPMKLPGHRRPPEFQGSQRNLQVFRILQSSIPEGLAVRADRPRQVPHHRCVEPAFSMAVDDYVQLISSTRPNWRAINAI